jgi:hypothetical protein
MSKSSRKKELQKIRKEQTNRTNAERQRLLRVHQRIVVGEFCGPYVPEYIRVCDEAKRTHPSLLAIVECDDAEFFEMDSAARIQHFGFAEFRLVIFEATGQIDFDSDPSTKDGRLNAILRRPDGAGLAGSMEVVTDGVSQRRTIVFMRRLTGTADGEPEVAHALKLTALLHEIGHITDFEQGLHFRDSTIDVVASEVFAHKYACNEMIRRKYLMPLGYYLDSLRKMAESESEYIKHAAKQVIASNDYIWFKSQVSQHYRGAN